MKLLVDMNLSPGLCRLLRDAGHTATHWSRIGSPRAPDIELLQWARRESHIVVTHDLDFGAILAATGFSSPSVIQIRRRDIMPSALIGVLCDALIAYENALRDGALVVIDELASRVRILPINR